MHKIFLNNTWNLNSWESRYIFLITKHYYYYYEKFIGQSPNGKIANGTRGPKRETPPKIILIDPKESLLQLCYQSSL